MQHDAVKESFSLLEERLESLESIALNNELQASDLVHTVRQQVQDLQFAVVERMLKQKSISAEDCLIKIEKILIAEARRQEVDIVLSTYGAGLISLPNLENAMGAILACLQASLESAKRLTFVERSAKYLFQPVSFHLQIDAGLDGINFMIVNDGRMFNPEQRENDFNLLREQIAKHGGWFSVDSLGAYGTKIHCKVPTQHIRVESCLLVNGSVQMALPMSRISQQYSGDDLIDAIASDTDRNFYTIDTSVGLRRLSTEEIAEGNWSCGVEIGVVDSLFFLLCDSLQPNLKVRKIPDTEFLQEDTWLYYLGVYQQGSTSQLVPVLEDKFLRDFYFQEHQAV